MVGPFWTQGLVDKYRNLGAGPEGERPALALTDTGQGLRVKGQPWLKLPVLLTCADRRNHIIQAKMNYTPKPESVSLRILLSGIW